MKRFFLLIIAALLVFSACRKENVISTDPSHKLVFSADTVIFDTVFTSIGSSTHQLKIYNNYNEDLNISEVRLMGGEQSRFKLNFDGESGTEFHDKIIPANDSLFTFMNVTIDPTDGALPFVVEDSLMFVTNGNTQMIKLVAWGQNAHYIVADRYISGFPKFKIVADSLETTHWYNDLPYVIYGYALINSYGTLHIHEGTHIYVHGGGGIWSWIDGQLIIEGTTENPVTIQGDRMEPFFKDQPGQWDRIWLMEARQGADHMIDHAIIRNAFIGIQAESTILYGFQGSHVTEAALRVSNTIIENNTGMGIYAALYAIEAKNTVIDNCAQYAFAIVDGGDYLLRHCTIGNYWWASPRTTSSVFLSNYEDQDGERYEFPFHWEMYNSIVYGLQEEELGTKLSSETEVDTTYLFDHCLMKTSKFSNDNPGFSSCIFNQDPMFTNYRTFDYHLSDVLSPAVGAGSPVIAIEIPYDIEGHDRRNTPDLGAYQWRGER
ncbi:MAG: hypothetical protein II887_00310 [Bacteroidales bacterium]|nr:hypothetical protein [Bacteroidales bacterium]